MTVHSHEKGKMDIQVMTGLGDEIKYALWFRITANVTEDRFRCLLFYRVMLFRAPCI